MNELACSPSPSPSLAAVRSLSPSPSPSLAAARSLSSSIAHPTPSRNAVISWSSSCSSSSSCDDGDSCSGAVAGAVAVEAVAAACLRRAFSRWHIQDLCCATRAARLFSLHSTWSGQLAARWAMHARSCARRGAAGGGVARACARRAPCRRRALGMLKTGPIREFLPHLDGARHTDKHLTFDFAHVHTRHRHAGPRYTQYRKTNGSSRT